MYWEYDSRLGRRWNLDPKPEAGWSNYSVNFNNPILISDPLGDKGGGDPDKVNKKTGLSSNDINRIQNSMANQGDKLSSRQINRMGRELVKNGGDWSKVILKDKTDFNLALSLAVNLPINKARNLNSNGQVSRTVNSDGLNLDVIIANQNILSNRAKGAFGHFPVGKGLNIENTSDRIVNKPAGGRHPLSGTNSSFRRVFADEITQTANNVGNGRQLLVGTKISITTDSPGTVIIKTFDSVLIGNESTNIVSNPFEFSSSGTKDLETPPPNMLPNSSTDGGYDIQHSNPNATTTIEYHFYIFNDIYVH